MMEDRSPATSDNQVMTLGQWLITLIILAIPVVGFIFLIVWAIGGPNQNKTNFCRACLVMAVLAIVVSIIFVILAGGSAALMMQGSL